MKRILVFGLTNSLAGTEAVISNIVQALDGEVSFDFLMFEEPDNYSILFEGTNRFFVLPNKRTHLFAYYRALRLHFDDHASEYSAVWANLNILNNVDALRLSAEYGIPKRILHAHNSRKDGRPHQRLLCALHKGTVDQYVTDCWACSRAAGDFFFGQRDYLIVPNAIDMEMFAYDDCARMKIRRELGISETDFVVGNVGRLTAQKGQDLLIRIMPQLLELKDNAYLVIIGTGELENELRELSHSLGVAHRVHFCASRSDVPACLSAFDVFALPSLFEGLPVSLLEAQANGLACIVSDTVDSSAIFTEGSVILSRMYPSSWAKMIARMTRKMVSFLPDERAQFDIHVQASMLRELF